MLRISVTTLEQFRKYIDSDIRKVWNRATESFDEYPMVTEEKLLDNITNPDYSTTSTDLGTAFHEILEEPHKAWYRYEEQFGELKDFLSENGTIFPYNIIDKVYELIDYNFPFEVKQTKIFLINDEEIELVAKIDQFEGLMVNEHKTKWGSITWGKEDNGEQFPKIWDPFEYEEYCRSCQWKLYLQIFEAIAVKYKVFSLAIDKTDNHTLKLIDTHQFELYPYEGMEDYTKSLIEQFVEYIHLRQLEEYFKPLKK